MTQQQQPSNMEIDGRITTLTEQRNNAMDAVVVLRGKIAVLQANATYLTQHLEDTLKKNQELEAKLAELTKDPEPSAPEEPVAIAVAEKVPAQTH